MNFYINQSKKYYLIDSTFLIKGTLKFLVVLKYLIFFYLTLTGKPLLLLLKIYLNFLIYKILYKGKYNIQ